MRPFQERVMFLQRGIARFVLADKKMYVIKKYNGFEMQKHHSPAS
jgi:hypothetical protein